MATEIEIKLRLADPNSLRRRLRSAGATRHGLFYERNTLFDRADRSLRAAGVGLRIRVVRSLDPAGSPSRATLTVKGPRRPGTLKAREEIECDVADADAVTGMLGLLGYRPTVIYEKRRESWRLDRASVEIDELPRLGWFAEIEAIDPDETSAEAAVLRVRTALGLDSAVAVPESYVELAAAECDPAAAVAELAFAPDAGTGG